MILPPPAREALQAVPARLDAPWLFVTRPAGSSRREASTTTGTPFARRSVGLGMDFYELRHFCATHLLELGVSHADVAVQLGHTDGGALVMSTYGHPSEDRARERLARVSVECRAAPDARRTVANGKQLVRETALLRRSSLQLNPPPP